MSNTATRGRFINPRTAGFYNHISKEYMDQMGQSLIYYQVDAQRTDLSDKNSIYRESTEKIYKNAVRLQAVIDMAPKQYENLNDIGKELITHMDAHFNIHDLKECSVFPSIGDIVSFQEVFYEIYDGDDSAMLHGSPEFKHQFTINCKDTRISDYEIQLLNDLEV